jgi:glutathione S-transferase
VSIVLTDVQLYRFRYSTNVDRIALALAHKGLEVESVWIDPEDRSPVEAVSGQSLVPVLIDGDEVISDSPRVIEHLEARHPDPPLFPADPARAAEVRVFVDWFNRVWKAEPNLLADGADGPRDEWAHAMRDRMQLFEGLLSGRDHLFGEFGAADCIAWPFLRYAAWIDDDDTDPFHHVLVEHLPLDDAPNVARWIQRIRDERWPAAQRV